MNDKAKRLGAVAAIATAIAIPAEGLRQFAYYDPPGILTVCFGSTKNVIRNRYYTLDECKLRLSDDMLEAVNAVEKCHPNLPQNVHAAFADATFNLGPVVACDSTASRFLEAGDFDSACRQLPRWNKARVAGMMVALPGLTKRRNAEMQLCLS